MKKSKHIAIQLRNITKEYIIHHEKPTLVEKFITSRREKFQALSGINMSIFKGEKVGIMGPNGSGKTTLLKIISGITIPTSGTVTVVGRIVSLIDLEAGFHPDISGEDNILINGLLLGMEKREIMRKKDKIIEFADIKQFIDIPIYKYSQGMKLRLGFSIAIHSYPDILILDENLSVGDEDFQEKSEKVIKDYSDGSNTLIFVSHSEPLINKYCKRIVYLQQGKLIDRS